jgi:hypothetical protein
MSGLVTLSGLLKQQATHRDEEQDASNSHFENS